MRCLAIALLTAALLPAQPNELSLQFGGTLTQRRTIALPQNLPIPGLDASLNEDNGYGGGIVYRVRLIRLGTAAALMAELPIFIVQATNADLIPLIAEPLFGNTSGVSGFITPGAVLRLAPDSVVSPYGFFGAGYARVVEAQLTSTAPIRGDFVDQGTWAISYGGGADLRLARFLAIRGELRNFYTGTTSTNATLLPGIETRQRNTLLLTGGLVFRF